MTAGKPIRTHAQTFQGYSTVTQALKNGFNVNKPLYTLDGDEAIVLGIDETHPFPIVGEVHDYGTGIFGTSWLARWSATGRYRGTLSAALKHSLERNQPKSHDAQFERGLAAGFKEATKPATNLGQLLRDKLDRDAATRKTGKTDGRKEAGCPAEYADKMAQQQRVERLKLELARVYASAWAGHSPMEIGAVAFHVQRLIDEGRLAFPDGLGDADFTDLRHATRVLSNNPGIRMEIRVRKWVNARNIPDASGKVSR